MVFSHPSEKNHRQKWVHLPPRIAVKLYKIYNELPPPGCFQKIGIPQNGWFVMEHPFKIDDLEVTPIFGNTHRDIPCGVPGNPLPATATGWPQPNCCWIPSAWRMGFPQPLIQKAMELEGHEWKGCDLPQPEILRDSENHTPTNGAIFSH